MVSLAKLGILQGRVLRANRATDATERFLCPVDASEKRRSTMAEVEGSEGEDYEERPRLEPPLSQAPGSSHQ